MRDGRRRVAHRGAGALGHGAPRQPDRGTSRRRYGRAAGRRRVGRAVARDRRGRAAAANPASARCGASRSRRPAAPNWPRLWRARLRRTWLLDWGGGLVWAAVPETGRRRRRGDPPRDPRRLTEAAPGTRRWSRPRPALRRAVAVFEPQPPALAALSRRVKEAFDPAHILNPGRMVPIEAGEAETLQTEFSLAQLADPDTAESEKILRDLRPLRVLHRDLPDLRAARRRTRQPARPHLPDQEHARTGRAGRAGNRQAHRPLPVVPVLHDDLPVRGQLHAPRRSRPAPYRGALPPALARAAAAPAARARADPPGPAARGAAPGAAWQAASPGSRRKCCARCWRWRRGAVPAASPIHGSRLSRPRASGACGSRCCRAARSRCWRRRSTWRRSGC